MNPLTQSKNATILPVLIALGLGCFGLSPSAQGVCQEGCLTIQNTFLGEDALLSGTGVRNTAIGYFALRSKQTGSSSDNTAIGASALVSNTTGFENTATGAGTLPSNTTGNQNTATGWQALLFNTTGGDNTANGAQALASNLTGSNNIAVGAFAGIRLRSGGHNIHIGHQGFEESGAIRIGATGIQTKTFIAGISGATVPTGVAVIVDGSGRLGTTTSSARFKEAIRPMDKASEAILALQPVTFRYKHDLDPNGIPQFGLVAEDVEKVNPDLVARDDQGKVYTVRYEAINAMLLNEFLKERRKVEQQEAAIGRLKQDFGANIAQQAKQIEALTATVKEQAAQMQKVSAQLELNKTAPQVVNNP